MKHISVVSALTLLVLFGGEAPALPRFAAQSGLKCQSCHVNPAGGGMRSARGAQFGRENLPVPQWSEDAGLEDISKLLPSFLGVGADFRTIYMVRQAPDSGGARARLENEFWQMQGDIYFNFQIAKRVNLYFKKGLYSGFEAYGLLNVLPLRGHVKIGKFIPNYGLRLDDHTAFIRTYAGLSPVGGRPEITGFEAGVSPGPAMITGGFYNAADGFGGTAGSDKAYLGRAEGMFGIAKDVYLGIGANVLRREHASGSATLLGGFASAGIGKFSVLGEGDFLRNENPAGTTTGVVVYGEANYTIIDGVDIQIAYDFYDPDKDHVSGTTSRYSVGIGFIPLGGVEVRPMFRLIQEDPVDAKNNEFHVQLHLYL